MSAEDILGLWDSPNSVTRNVPEKENKKIGLIGLGRLGLCLGLTLAEKGFQVLGSDIRESYVKSLEEGTFRSEEPEVNELLEKYYTQEGCIRLGESLKATTDSKSVLDFSDLILIMVATPTGIGENAYDTTSLSGVLDFIESCNVSDKHIVIGCTVLPGYCDNIGKELLKGSIARNCTLSYNPEFIAQGAIVRGLRAPDMVLIGEGSSSAGDRLEKLYRECTDNEPTICRMSTSSAEIMKLSLNCFITTKIAYANMIGDIADRTPGADKYAILKAVGSDSRISPKCLRPSISFGGPCFPRDNRALGIHAKKVGVNPIICEATDNCNKDHTQNMVNMIIRKTPKKDIPSYGISNTVVFEDVAYKPNCPVNIIEESAKIEMAKILVKEGYKVVIRDRKGIIDLVRKTYGSLFKYEINDNVKISQEIEAVKILIKKYEDEKNFQMAADLKYGKLPELEMMITKNHV